MKPYGHIGENAGLSFDRRQVLVGAGAAGLGLRALGSTARAADAPKKGGTLRLGMAGGSASDSLDPRTYSDAIPIAIANQIFNGFIDIDEQGNAQGELLESWETKPGAAEWVFNVRKGIEFHSGKKLDADDIIYSINLHRGETKSGGKDLLSAITDVKKLSPTQIGITLSSRQRRPALYAHRLSLLRRSERLHGLVQARRHRRLSARELRARRAGLTKNTGRYWKPNRAWFDCGRAEVHPRCNPPASRRCSPARSMRQPSRPQDGGFPQKSPRVNVVQTKGTGNRFAFAALCDTRPTTASTCAGR